MGEAIDLWYSGKAHTHGGNIQAVLAPNGSPLWLSAAEPGSVYDITAARLHALPALCRGPGSHELASQAWVAIIPTPVNGTGSLMARDSRSASHARQASRVTESRCRLRACGSPGAPSTTTSTASP
jgi:hypothetical protein